MEEKKTPTEWWQTRAGRDRHFREVLERSAERERELALARGEQVPPAGWYKTREGRDRRFRELLERAARRQQAANG